VTQAKAQTFASIGPTPLTYVQAPNNPDTFASGRVSSIAVDPSDPNHWLVGAGNGGVWETHDGGGNFIPLSDAWPTLALGAVTFGPSDPKTIYVATGEATLPGYTHAGLGIMKSTDGGQTWNLLGASSFARGSARRIRVHPTNPNVVVATVSRGGFGRDTQEGTPSPPPFGVVKSTDGGATWRRTLAGQATALEIDGTNFNNQYAAIGEQRIPNGFTFEPKDAAVNGVYRSTDGGDSWTLISGPWGTSTSTRAAVGRVELAIAPSNPNVLYASIQVPPNGGSSATGLLGLYRTDNAWDLNPTWIQVSTRDTGVNAYCGPGKCGYSHVISVDPADADSLFAFGGEGGSQAWRCNKCSGSPTWVNIIGTVHPDYHAAAWAGRRLIVGSDGGVWSTTDLGNSWQDHNLTLSTGMFYSAALHPTDPNFILGGLRDFQIALRTASATWAVFPRPSPGGEEWGEAEVAISSGRPNTDWMSNHCCDGTIWRTRDGGITAAVADAGIDKTAIALVAPVRKCPGNDDVFLTGTNRMWRTDNFFRSDRPSWSANGPVLSGQNGGPSVFPSSPATILEIAFITSDATCNSYALGNRAGQVQLTRDGGKTWTDLDPSKNLPPRPVNGLAFDPTNPNIAYAALSNFDDATPGKPGHVFKSTNVLSAAPTWVNVSPPLNQPFNVLRVDPSNPKLIYAGSDTGLWKSTDAASTWVHIGVESGIPNGATVHDIQINPTTGVTAVLTYGRGAFAIGVPHGPQLASGLRSPANGATYISGGLVPGSWAQLQGTNLSNVTRMWNDADFDGLGNALPTKLSGVEVKVNGASAAMYYVSPTQVSFQVPGGILNGPAGNVLVSNPVTVQVFRDGVGSNQLTTTATSSSPGIFPIIVNGKNYPAGVFLDGKITGDPANGGVFRKARPGDAIQLYLTGLIRTTGGVVTNFQTYQGVTVKIGDIAFPADAAALVAPGEFQINFKVPQDFAALPAGDYPVSVQVKLDNGAITSSPAVINSDPPGPVLIPIQP
jgi:uncharacterized protein (TIGR03437 family)